MFSAMVVAACLVAADDGSERTLDATYTACDKLIIALTAVDRRLDGPQEQHRITDYFVHFQPAEFRFQSSAGFRGVVPPAKGGEQRLVTAVRNTYRAVEDGYFQFTSRLAGEGGNAMQDVHWVESKKPARAFPGGRLEARLCDGDEKGKLIFRCVSEVTGDAKSGYTYTLSVENHTDRRARIQWAGLDERIDPGKTFTKREQSGKLTEEVSDLASLTLDDGRDYAIRANSWGHPK